MGKKNDGPLPRFDGKDVISAGVKLGGAGTGLSAALAVDPVAYHPGETLYVVLEVEVDEVAHARIKDTQALTRVHKLKAQTATFVDADLVMDHLEKQRIRIEEAKGVHRLPLGDEDGDPADPAQTGDEAWQDPEGPVPE